MEKIVEQGLLYDFYGELLTEHQRRIYEDAVYNDLSLAEIAEETGISRQGVHDLLRRCSHTLKGYEDRLHLVQRFYEIRQKVQGINQLTENRDMEPERLREEIRRLSKEILEAL
ncbi:MAG: DNA-binding protein [Lachnospiraceae bacterium]|nr:DNA-binding protein [Lachnospiraceae bacterium]